MERRGQPADAISAYQKVLSREPSNIDALIGFGRLQVAQGQLADAMKALRRVATLQPGHALGQALLGMALARAGQPQEALAAFERASAGGNTPPIVLLHMADVLGTLGRHADALATFDRLLVVEPGNIIAWNNRGLALEALGRDGEAAESFGRALALRPGVPEIHFSLGNALYRLERYEEAEPHHRRTVAAWPAFARGHANLGNTLIKLKRWEDALQSLRRAVELDPRQPEVAKLHIGIATALRHLQREPESLASFDAALAIEPDNADAIARKAYILHTLGRTDEAQALIDRAAELHPDKAAPYTIGARMRRFRPGDPAIARMEGLLANDSLPDSERADLHFALGKAYDDTAAFDNAFPHFAAGNAIMRAGVDYQEDLELAGKARIVEVFTPGLMRRKTGHGHASDRPIFIIGMPRSGTTLIEQIIASHPLVFGAGEQKAFRETVEASVQPGQPIYPTMAAFLTAETLETLSSGYLARMAAVVPDGRRFTDKLPGNYNYAGLIHLAFPKARIVHVQRDPVDTCFSIFSVSLEDPLTFSHDLAELGRFYRAYERVMAHWRQVLPENTMLDVQYEDIIDDIEGQARRLIAFCGLEWDEACLAFHTKSRTVRTASAYQVRQPLYRGSVGRWRAYQKHLAPLIEALGDAATG